MTFKLYNKQWYRITTGYSELDYAKKKAGEIYDRARFMEEMGFPISPKKFKVVAEQLAQELQRDLDSGVGKKIYVDYLAVIKAYLRLGGFVGDGAWIDREFNTTDVCLVMDTARMSGKHRDFWIRKNGPRS